MLELMKLEIKKVKMGGYIKGAVIANLIMIAIGVIMLLVWKNEGNMQQTSLAKLFSMNGMAVKAIFVVMASVLITRFIIEEYKNNTIALLFMYPINRKKLMIAKLLVVVSFTFVCIVLSSILLDVGICIMSNFFNFTPDKLSSSLILTTFMTICGGALTFSCLGLIPLYFGMRKKSIPTTIVSSILIVSMLNASAGESTSLRDVVAVTIVLAIIGVFIAYLSIRNIEHEDVIK